MGQLQLFTAGQLAVMRDRTASRNYSPESDAFRRGHERHRAWGLQRRHAERLRRLRASRALADEASHHKTAPPADEQPPHRSPSAHHAEAHHAEPDSGSRSSGPADHLEFHAETCTPGDGGVAAPTAPFSRKERCSPRSTRRTLPRQKADGSGTPHCTISQRAADIASFVQCKVAWYEEKPIRIPP